MRISDWSSDVCSSDLHCDERRPRYRAATAFGASAPEDARRPRYRQLRAVPSRTGVYAEHHLPKGGSTTLTICIGYRRCLGGGRRDVGKCLLHLLAAPIGPTS